LKTISSQASNIVLIPTTTAHAAKEFASEAETVLASVVAQPDSDTHLSFGCTMREHTQEQHHENTPHHTTIHPLTSYFRVKNQTKPPMVT